MVRRFIAIKEKDAFEARSSKKALKQRTAINAEKRSSSVKFLQSGLLQDFKVNLVRCSVDGTIKKESNVLKKSASESERTKCNDCDKTFQKSSSLWKHTERFHRGKTYSCGVCGLICAYKYSIESHCSIKGHDKDLINVIVDLPVP